MPSTVAGKPLTARTAREARYADGTRFTVESLANAAPGMSMAQFFPEFRSGGDITVTGQNKPGEPLLWFVGHGRPPYQDHVAGVASATGTSMFGIEATSPDALDELAAALTAATR